MKKSKAVTINERFFKYTGEPVDYLNTGDILRLRQISPLDRPNLYAWRLDYFHAKNIGHECINFSKLCSTDYDRGDSPITDFDSALKWVNEMYHGLEQIYASWPGANGGLTIFGNRTDFNRIQDDFKDMMDEFRKKHPEALISHCFDWSWLG